MDKNVHGYSITLQLANEPCLVVGGGGVAERKTLGLLRSGARVTVCSPILTPVLASLQASKQIVWQERFFQPGDTAGYLLVIASTDDDALNRRIAEEVKKQGKLVNVATAPEAGNFNVQAFVSCGDLLLTVSTGGKSPALSRLIRQELSELYGEEMNDFLQFLETQRLQLQELDGASKDREKFWRQLLRPEWLGAVRAGGRKEIEGKIRDAVSRFGAEP